MLVTYEEEKRRLEERQAELMNTHNWADLFDMATSEAKHMILSELIERVSVGNGYDIQISLRISATQFYGLTE